MKIIKGVLRWVLRRVYSVEVQGMENLKKAGNRVLIVANHTSFLDPPLLVAFLPDRLTFAINTHIAQQWWIRPFLGLVETFSLDPTNPLSTKSLIRYLKEGRKVVIFPEGRITVTGALMKIYQGPGMVADKAEATVLPIRIEGAQYTPFSRLRGRVRMRFFPKISLHILPPQKIDIPSKCKGQARRDWAGKVLADRMTEMVFATTDTRQTLFEALMDARAIHGGQKQVVEDIKRQPLSYNHLLLRVNLLSQAIEADSELQDVVGLLLPNMTTTLVIFLALHTLGRVPALLNFTVGAKDMQIACETAQIQLVYSSKLFIEQAKLTLVVAQLHQVGVRVLYLEDLAERISPLRKLLGLAFYRLAFFRYCRRCFKRSADDPAVILFTSGSEGTPKGVVLSHANLLANRAQLAARVDFSSQDIILNAMPMFHSFGLTAGTILPLLSGMKTFFYPSPLHYRIVPEIAYDIGATVLFGTNTFLAGYLRYAHPYDFYSIRHVFAGAEKLQEEVRRGWADRFGVRIFEGYGATEASPVLATNTPMDFRPGTTGRLLPGIEYHLEPVPGILEGGRCWVKGPNIMRGYYLHQAPGQLVPPVSETLGKGWYDTGDIIAVDTDGYVHILGRAKRFAKIAGEMVSLSAVEALAERVWPGIRHVVVAIPDTQKGERLVLLSEQAQLDRKPMQRQAKKEGISELNVPRTLLFVKNIPLLGTGKTDYSATQALVLDAKDQN